MTPGPGQATDSLVRRSFCTERRGDGYTVVETPSRPDFWFGNALVLDRAPAPVDYERWLARHAAIFAGTPVVKHVVQWEIAGPRLDLEPPERLEVDWDVTSVLVSDVTPDRVVREDVVLRELSAPSDWSQVAALELEHSAEAELDFAEFFAWRTRMVRRDAECGRALVWGAFAGDSLLAYAGCYPSEAYIRLTTPVTVKARRRQGLFSALFARSVGAARGRFASARIVVVAQPGSAPERLYRSLGFAVAGYQYAILV